MLGKVSRIDDLKKKTGKKEIMKKILLALFVLAIAAAPALAATGVSIQWDTYWGAYTHDATDLTSLSGPFMLANYSVTWQLIYAGTDDTANDPDTSLGGAGIADDYVTGDDVVWASRVFSVNNGNASDGTVWTTDLYWSSGDRTYNDTTFLTSGEYIYQRIFEGTPAAGSYYYESALEALEINPSASQISLLDAAGGGTSGIQGNQTIPIPEPATMSLLGLGALAMAVRRRRS